MPGVSQSIAAAGRNTRQPWSPQTQPLLATTESADTMPAVAGGLNMDYVALLLVPLAIFWVYEFVQLMLLADGDFPGRYDKALWVVAFVVLFVIAPFAFLYWKRASLTMRAADWQPPDQSPK
jgi:hypothetical protein